MKAKIKMRLILTDGEDDVRGISEVEIPEAVNIDEICGVTARIMRALFKAIYNEATGVKPI